jgi:hypothetical protein
MEKTVIASAIPEAVVAARGECVAKITEGKGVIAAYAKALETAFNIVDAKTGKILTPWYALKGKAKAPVKAENLAFKLAINTAGFAKGVDNTYWGRVKTASGYQAKGKASTADMTVDDKSLAELKTLINRAYKADEDGEDGAEKTLKMMGKLKDVYKALGGDVDKLG